MKNALPTVILCTDGYKLGHRQQYPDGTTQVYTNFTGRFSRTTQDKIVQFGLQFFLQKWLMDEFENFFSSDKETICNEYTRRVNGYLGPNNIGTEHIAQLHDLQYLPLEFRALPEGTLVPIGIPVLTVTNTHPDFFWLVNYIETLLSSELWMPMTSATTAHTFRKILDKWATKTGSDPTFVPFQGHDFSMRGMSGTEAAMSSGAGHLVSFCGTDTIPAIEFVERYYPNNPDDNSLIGCSVSATEHSVMCAGGSEPGDELATFERLLFVKYPTGILSVVSDTWDLWIVITSYLPKLKDRILARDGKLVIRPDSGDPVKIICGDSDADPSTPQHKGVIELLWDIFGGTVTSTGHRMLDSHIGAIYGDSITEARCEEICRRLAEKGFASGNMVFGIGSFTYQYVTRDTYSFAAKATYAVVNGEPRELYKDPVTDKKKKSAKGLLAVREVDGELVLFDQCTREESENDSLLKLVWKDGNFVGPKVTFSEIREKLATQRALEAA